MTRKTIRVIAVRVPSSDHRSATLAIDLAPLLIGPSATTANAATSTRDPPVEIGRGNPRVKKLYPYPYPPKPLPLIKGRGFGGVGVGV